MSRCVSPELESGEGERTHALALPGEPPQRYAMIDHQRGSRPPAATAFVLLALMLCGASTSVSAASWRPLHQSAARSSGGATAAGNQLRKRSSGYARRYDPAGAQPAENYALADGLINALRNSPYASHIPGSSEYESR